MDSTPAELGKLLGPLRRAVLRATREDANLPDLPEAQIELLRTLATSPRRPSAIASQLCISATTVSNLIKAMTKAGLVLRVADPEDQRATLLHATPHALALLQTYDKASARLLACAMASLPANDRPALANAIPALQRLLANLGQIQLAASGCASTANS